MKKILSAICPVLSVLLLSNIGLANDFDYSINKYDIDLNFKRNNTIQVKEVIDASFNKERNGISRKLNLKNKKLDDVDTNFIHVISKNTDGDTIIKIVDSENKRKIDREYSLKYNLISKEKLFANGFSYDIIDGSWERNIDQVNFKITIPERELMMKKVEFISSVSGIATEDNLQYSVSGNTITGTYAKPLVPHETLTMHLTSSLKKSSLKKHNKLVLNNIKNENMTVYVGDEIIIRLNSNPSTGFTWKFNVDSETEDILSISEEKFIAVKTSAVAGAGGVSEFTIKALKPGEAKLTGVYIRPWLKYEDEDENSVHYTITVKSKKK